MRKIVQAVQAQLTDELRRPPYRGNPNPLAGHCYVACEVLAALLGKEWKPHFVRHEGAPHWYLRHRTSGMILDPTASQFKTPVPYHLGIGKGFLTNDPSARARVVLNRLDKTKK